MNFFRDWYELLTYKAPPGPTNGNESGMARFFGFITSWFTIFGIVGWVLAIYLLVKS